MQAPRTGLSTPRPARRWLAQLGPLGSRGGRRRNSGLPLPVLLLRPSFHCGPRPGVCVDRRVGSSPHTGRIVCMKGIGPAPCPLLTRTACADPREAGASLEKSGDSPEVGLQEDQQRRPRRRAVVRPATLPRPGPAFARRRQPTQSSGRRAQAGRCGGCLPGAKSVPLCPGDKTPTPAKSFVGPG